MRKLHILLLLLFTVGPMITSQAQFEAAEDITISKPYDGDLYVAGGSVSVEAPVSGDVIAAGGSLYIRDSVGQDLLIAGGDIMIYGPVGDDVRTAGGNITVSNTIGDDLLIFAGDIELTKDAVVMGDLIIFGGNVMVDGEVKGNVKIYAGEVELNGPVTGDVDAKLGEIEIKNSIQGNVMIAADEITLGSNARIGKDLIYWTDDGELDLDQSKVGGTIRFDEQLSPDSDIGRTGWFAGGIFFFLVTLSLIISTLLVIILLKFLFGRQLDRSAMYLKDDIGGSIGYGILYLFGIPLISALLFILIIGIPAGFLLLSIYIFSLIFGHALVSLIIVYYFNEQRDQKWNSAVIVLLAWAVSVALRFIGFIPFAGWLISLVVIAAGFGAIIKMTIQTNRERKMQMAP